MVTNGVNAAAMANHHNGTPIFAFIMTLFPIRRTSTPHPGWLRECASLNGINAPLLVTAFDNILGIARYNEATFTHTLVVVIKA
jgi:hypothetical protein